MTVITCTDCQLVQMFEQALGLERGDVLEHRTSGATISAPERERAANDLISSLVGHIYLLEVREVAVIGHAELELSHVDPTTVIASMQALGVAPSDSFSKRAWAMKQVLRAGLAASVMFTST